MLDTIKKTILTGVGAAIVTSEKVQSAFSDLVAQGKVTAEDARTLAERISADGKREFERESVKVSEQVHSLIQRGNEATQQRLAALERKLKSMQRKPATKPAAVKKEAGEGRSHQGRREKEEALSFPPRSKIASADGN